MSEKQVVSRKRPLSEKDEQEYFCRKCNISFSLRGNLNKHLRRFHAEDFIVQGTQSCGLCNDKFSSMKQLQEHVQNRHSVALKFVNEKFNSESDFLDWKMKTERESKSSFNLKRTWKNKTNNKKISDYICHRIGHHEDKDNRTRHMKASGSIKCSSTCPATMKVTTETVDEIMEIHVKYQSVHIGHELEVGKLPLSNKEKTSLAASLTLGIPFAKILDETRQNFNPTNRISFTTRKDLQNINKAFQIGEHVLHADDSTSVDLLVKKMSNEDDNPILVYKPVGEVLPDFPGVKEKDFLLGMMNSAQQKLFELYGNSCIMIDSTHGMNQYSFELLTIMVHDENHEGLPVATLFSSRMACEVLLPFFQSIKERLPNLTTNVLMTDDTTSFLNAWEKIFSDNPRHLLCSWHVNKNWNINIQSKIKNKENRIVMKKLLDDLHTETDVATFDNLVENFIKSYKEKEIDFVEYFTSNYLNRPQKWAYCHRTGLGINTNMKLERWHRQLKYEEGEGKVVKRIDMALSLVINAVAKKLISRVISMERGKLTSRVSLIRKRHSSSSEMGNEYGFVNLDNTFILTKQVGSSLFSYEIEKFQNVCECKIRCEECCICIHMMSCTCVDYSVRFLICKHIHFICKESKNRNKDETPQINEIENLDDNQENNLVIEEQNPNEKHIVEKNAIVSYLQKDQIVDFEN